MGIFIHMSISKSVTKCEWEKVYEETLQLVKAFPLAERREFDSCIKKKSLQAA